MKVRHLRLQIFLTFSSGYGAFEAHFLIKNVLIKKTCIYQFLGPSWSQNEKYSEFIEIWLSWYFQYANFDFKVKNKFYEILPVRAKLAPKLNMLRIYWNLAYLIFQICRFWYKCPKKKIMNYLPPFRLRLVRKLKVPRIYESLVHLIFQIYRFRVSLWCIFHCQCVGCFWICIYFLCLDRFCGFPIFQCNIKCL